MTSAAPEPAARGRRRRRRAAGKRVDALVDGDQRRKQAERQHRAGHGVAEPATDVRRRSNAARSAPPARRREAEHERGGGGRGEPDRGQGVAARSAASKPTSSPRAVTWRERSRPAAGSRAGPERAEPRRRDGRRRAAERDPDAGGRRRRDGEALVALAVALERDQRGDDRQHHAGDLRRARRGCRG